MVNAFQTSVPSQLAPGIEGGWADFNPSVSLLPPQNGDITDPTYTAWKVAPSGVIVGRFAFADTTTGLVSSANPGTGAMWSTTAPGRIRYGFVQRDQFTLITPYLGGDSVSLFGGQDVTLLSRCGVWAKFAAGAAVGSFIFASFADGSCIAGATNTPPTTTFLASTTNGSANLTAVGAGAVAGQPISGTGIPAGTYLVSVSGTTAVMSANATATNAGITVTANTAALTDFRVLSLAAAGELAKISVWG